MLCSSNNANTRRKRRVSTITLIFLQVYWIKKTRVHLLWALTVKIFDLGFEFDGSAT